MNSLSVFSLDISAAETALTQLSLDPSSPPPLQLPACITAQLFALLSADKTFMSGLGTTCQAFRRIFWVMNAKNSAILQKIIYYLLKAHDTPGWKASHIDTFFTFYPAAQPGKKTEVLLSVVDYTTVPLPEKLQKIQEFFAITLILSSKSINDQYKIFLIAEKVIIHGSNRFVLSKTMPSLREIVFINTIQEGLTKKSQPVVCTMQNLREHLPNIQKISFETSNSFGECLYKTWTVSPHSTQGFSEEVNKYTPTARMSKYEQADMGVFDSNLF